MNYLRLLCQEITTLVNPCENCPAASIINQTVTQVDALIAGISKNSDQTWESYVQLRPSLPLPSEVTVLEMARFDQMQAKADAVTPNALSFVQKIIFDYEEGKHEIALITCEDNPVRCPKLQAIGLLLEKSGAEIIDFSLRNKLA